MLFRVAEGPDGLGAAVDDLCKQASQAIKEGYKFLILSDRGVNEEWAPIPSLLGISAVHHHLVRECTRTEVGLILETGEPRDVHQFACLIGYGAGTINPYLVFESLVDMERDNYLPEGLDAQTAEGKFIKAINKGLLKIFSKMGISTVQSYCGAQIFEAIGLNHEFIDRYFTGTPSRSKASGFGRSVKKRCAGIAWRMNRPPSGNWISAARFTTAFRGSTITGTRTRSTNCSMRPRANNPKTYHRIFPAGKRREQAAIQFARAARFQIPADADSDRRSGAGKRHCQALQDGRHVVRRDQ